MRPRKYAVALTDFFIGDTIIKKLRLIKGDKIAVSMKGGRIKLVKVKSKDNRGK